MVNTVGQRLREVRSWRGLDLRTAAELSGISHGYLGQLERGDKPLTNRKVLEALCRTLRIAPTELTQAPYSPTDPDTSEAHAGLRGVEIALSSFDLGVEPNVLARPWQQLAGEVEHLNTVLRVNVDYAAQGVVVPDLLEQLHAAYVQQPQFRTHILERLVQVYHSACMLTSTFGLRGFPVIAARGAERCAQELADPRWLGVASYLRGHATGSMNRSVQYSMSVLGIESLSGSFDNVDVLQIGGMLHLHAALASASMGDGDQSQEHIEEATDLARRLPSQELNFAFLQFGENNVNTWRMNLAIELGRPGEAISSAKKVHPEQFTMRERFAVFYADLGRALAADKRTRDRAIPALMKAEQAAPQRIRNTMFVRETVADLLRHARRDAGGRDLRYLAWRMGVAPAA